METNPYQAPHEFAETISSSAEFQKTPAHGIRDWLKRPFVVVGLISGTHFLAFVVCSLVSTNVALKRFYFWEPPSAMESALSNAGRFLAYPLLPLVGPWPGTGFLGSLASAIINSGVWGLTGWCCVRLFRRLIGFH